MTLNNIWPKFQCTNNEHKCKNNGNYCFRKYQVNGLTKQHMRPRNGQNAKQDFF